MEDAEKPIITTGGNESAISEAGSLRGLPNEKASFGTPISRDFLPQDFPILKLIESYRKEIEEIKENLKSLKGEFAKNKGAVERDLERSRLDSLQILAIFVALFTFISVEFQIFRSSVLWQAAASFSLILLGALAFFASFLWLVSSDDKRENKGREDKKIWCLLIMSLVVILCGIAFLFVSRNAVSEQQEITAEKIFNEKAAALKSDHESVRDEVWQLREQLGTLQNNTGSIRARNPYLK